MSQPSPQFGKSLFLIPSPQGNHGLLYTGHHRAADGNPILVGQHQPRTIQLLDVVEVYKIGPVRKDKAGIIDFGKQLFDPTVVLKVPLPVRDDLDAALHFLDVKDVLVENAGIVLIVLHHNRTGIRFFQSRKGLLQGLWQSVLQIQFGNIPQQSRQRDLRVPEYHRRPVAKPQCRNTLFAETNFHGIERFGR